MKTNHALFVLLFIFSIVEANAAGCISGNCINGRGTYQWSGGEQYSGDWQNQQKHGYGTYIYQSGEKYTGDWRFNKKQGQGIYIWPGGYQFSGGWQNNLAHGKGIYTYPNGQRSNQVLNMGKLISEEAILSQPPTSKPTNIPNSAPSSMPSGRRWKKAQ